MSDTTKNPTATATSAKSNFLWEEQHDRSQSRENCKCLAVFRTQRLARSFGLRGDTLSAVVTLRGQVTGLPHIVEVGWKRHNAGT